MRLHHQVELQRARETHCLLHAVIAAMVEQTEELKQYLRSSKFSEERWVNIDDVFLRLQEHQVQIDTLRDALK